MSDNDPVDIKDLPQAPVRTLFGLGDGGYGVVQEVDEFLLQASETGPIASRLDNLEDESFEASPYHQSVELGLAATQIGEQFRVVSDSTDISHYIYRNDGDGSSTLLASPVSPSAMASMRSIWPWLRSIVLAPYEATDADTGLVSWPSAVLDFSRDRYVR